MGFFNQSERAQLSVYILNFDNFQELLLNI